MRLFFPSQSSAVRRVPPLPQPDFEALLIAQLTADNGEAGTFLPSKVTASGGNVVQTVGLRGIVFSDGGVAARRPAWDGVSKAHFNGTTNFLVGTTPAFDGARACTKILRRSVVTDDTIGLEISDNINHIAELGTTGGFKYWCRFFKDAFGDGQCAPSSGAIANLSKSMAWQSGVIDFQANPVVKEIHQSGRDDLIARVGTRNGAVTAAGVFAAGTKVGIGARISGASPCDETVEGWIVVPRVLTRAEVAAYIDLFNGMLNQQGVPTAMLLRRSQVSDDMGLTGRVNKEKWVVDVDAVTERANFEGLTNLRPGDSVTERRIIDLQADQSVGHGRKLGYHAVTSIGNHDNVALDGDWTIQDYTYVVDQLYPRMRLTTGGQAYAPSYPNDGVFLHSILLPANRTFAPVTQTTTRRLCFVCDFPTLGATNPAGSPNPADDYMTKGASYYLDANYPGRTTFFGSDVLSYKKLVDDFGSNAAAGAAIAAVAPNAGDEIVLAIGWADVFLDNASYANLAAFRARIAAFLTAIRGGSAARIFVVTLFDDALYADPTPTFGSIAAVQAAMAGAIGDSGIANCTAISGHNLWGSRDAWGPNLRAGMGTW